MANTNVANGNQKTPEIRFCSVELTTGIHNVLIFLSVVNIVLSVTAFLGNTLILVALYKKTLLHLPSKLLYRSLATTDLCVGIIVEPLAVTYLLSMVNEQWNICHHAFDAAFVTSNILCSVSLFTVTAIGVDRLLALLLGLRYRQLVTLKRIYLTITGFWVVSIVGTAMYFWNHLVTRWYGYIVISLCSVTSIVCHTIFFLTLRHHQTQVHDNIHQVQPNQGIPVNIARYKKVVSSALWVQMALVVCYLPHGVIVAWLTQNDMSSSDQLAWFLITATLVYFNSSLNPALYCWKMKEVRQAVRDMIRQLSSSFC